MSDHSNISQPTNSASVFTWQILVTTLCRLLLYTARRFAYPFAPVLSRGLDVSLTAITLLIAVNQATTVLGLLFGPIADRVGYRLMMLTGLSMFVAGMLAGGFLPYYGVILAVFFLTGLARSIFDPALQAYVSGRVPYERRGFFIGLIECSWAGSALVGIPLIALLIDGLGWRAPFFAMGGAGLLGVFAVKALIYEDGRKGARQKNDIAFKKVWLPLIKDRSALAMIGFAFFATVANDTLFVVYGAWLETTFNLSIVAIGLGTIVIGLAELAGSGLTAFFADRFGLRRALVFGLILTMLSYSMLPVFEHTLHLTLGGLFVLFFAFEFTAVTGLSLCTEVLPGTRATMMAGFYAASGIGRFIGVLIGMPVWLLGGMFSTGLVSTGITGLGLISLLWGLRGWEHR